MTHDRIDHYETSGRGTARNSGTDIPTEVIEMEMRCFLGGKTKAGVKRKFVYTAV